nr:hypothetical protein [Actinomycetes bacterium]
GSMLSSMGGMPAAAMGAAGGMPGMGPGPMGALSGLMSPLTKLANTTTEGGNAKLAAAIADRGLDTTGQGKADERGLQKYTKLMNRAVSNAFPEIKEIGGWRQDALKWHPNGLALDIMIPEWNTAEGRDLGNRIVNYLIRNQKPLGLDHMIWRQQMIQPDGSSSLMGKRDGDTANHMDHIHAVSLGGGY